MYKLMYRTMLTSMGLALAVSFTACKKDKASDNNATYTSRAYVEALPTKDRAEIMLLHEEIPDFVTSRGKKQKMASMSMPFGVGSGLSTDTLAVGDAVEFTFDTDWSKKPVSTVTAITKLPADTKLDVSRPKMPGKEHGGGHGGHGSGTGGGGGGGGSDNAGDGDGHDDHGAAGDKAEDDEGDHDEGDHGGDGSGSGGGDSNGAGGGDDH